MKWKCRNFTCNSKADKISSVYHTNQTKKMKRVKQKKNRWALSPEMVIKICEIRQKRWGTMERRIYGKGKFWVWSGTEMEWCIVKVMIMMVMMMNRWEKDEITVTGTHHRQVGEDLWEVHSRDEVMHGGKSDCWLSKRNKKVDEQEWQYQRNECCEVRHRVKLLQNLFQ